MPAVLKKPAASKRSAPAVGAAKKKTKFADIEEEGEADMEAALITSAKNEAAQGFGEIDGASCNLVCTVLDTLPLRAVRSFSAARSLIDGVQLTDKCIMPAFGYGTYKLKKGDAFEPVSLALKLGYRLIDTAQIYDNEADVGKALRLSGIPRDRVFIETKHWRSSHGYDRTLEACRKSMKRLGVDYLDLYLIHWPGCKTGWPLARGVCSPKDWTPTMRDKGTYRAMEDLYLQGKLRAIGVSNYSVRHLKKLLATCRVKPAVNQVEFHPWLVQSKLLEFCKENGIVLQAYASLGSGDVKCRADFFAIPEVRACAKKYDKTSAQVLLRWALEKGVAVIPKSKSHDRIVENFGVFDFKLTAAEVATIDACHKDKRFAWKGVDPDTVE